MPREIAAMGASVVVVHISKAVGITTLATASANKLAAVCATVSLKNCSFLRSPPKKKHMPRTSNRFDKILPINDVWTTTTSFDQSNNCHNHFHCVTRKGSVSPDLGWQS